MSQSIWKSVDHYFNTLLINEDPALQHALQNSQDAGLPAIQVAANQGKFLHLLAQIQGAKHILEIGTLGGYSTIWLARALPPNGKLISLEINPHHADIAAQNIAAAQLADRVEIQVGAALPSLEKLFDTHGTSFDFIFIDADKQNNLYYFEWALKLAHVGTVIVVDNVVRRGEVANPDNHEPDVEGVRQLTDYLSREPRISATALQTVGEKSYDGFILARVIA
ncbi:MAG: O-methyltransferase [Acinetobacter populi]|jgi:predicted O-methyltransferase YrrM|uniref:O-methyltransferase n=1 Tax=Acinetobacter populi TaxID=1582270 RepID=UPI002352D421|nr:O-methyltransferase [Acinetobacter populi]MCH4249225.1 O-methyltransferase [Acinetobacter populi]